MFSTHLWTIEPRYRLNSFGRRRFSVANLEFDARQSSWPRTESRYFQTSAEDIHFCKILTTKCIKCLRDLFEYALYKFTLYLLTYLLSNLQVMDTQLVSRGAYCLDHMSDCVLQWELSISKILIYCFQYRYVVLYRHKNIDFSIYCDIFECCNIFSIFLRYLLQIFSRLYFSKGWAIGIVVVRLSVRL